MTRKTAPPSLQLVSSNTLHTQGAWAQALKSAFLSWMGRRRAYQPIPKDLLADVLADNELRIREEQQQTPRISGPWT